MSLTTTSGQREVEILSRSLIEDLIAQGRHIVIVEGSVLKIDSWLRFHPGGDKAIMHMVGRDGTDEINALHSLAARNKMSKYQIGRIEGRWQNFVPPIQGGRFRTLKEQEIDEKMGAVEEVELDVEDSSEESDAASVFDDAGLLTDGLRRRHTAFNNLTRTSSATSTSSCEEGYIPSKEDAGAAQTQKELDADLAKYPSLDPQVQDDIIQKYRIMERKVRDEGLYNCNYKAYMIELSRYVTLFGLSVFFLNRGWYAVSGLFLGMFWHQLVFTAHDAGHIAITHNYQLDTTIGIFVADWIGGLSLGWWKRSHNVHHIVTNSPEHDPDIELMPFFAVSHRFFDNLRSTYYDAIMPFDAVAKVTVQYQHWLYYPILMLGRFNLYVLSWDYILMGRGPRQGAAWWHRWFEVAGQIFFWTWFGYFMVGSCPTWWSRIVFVMVSHCVTAPLHVQITLSHYAMSTSDLGQAESFPQKMLRTTMDVDCPEWLDWFHGGLQFQAVHHLYPRLPRHNLRRAQKLVQQFCDETGIPYALYGFVDGNKEVISRLKDVGRQASVLAECQRVTAAKGMAGVFEH